MRPVGPHRPGVCCGLTRNADFGPIGAVVTVLSDYRMAFRCATAETAYDDAAGFGVVCHSRATVRLHA